jgi:hypothetical protein
MLGNPWFKKEKPLPSLIGMGGGAQALSQSSGVSFKATGGNQSPGDGLEPGNGYKYHVYTSTGEGTFEVTAGTTNVDILVLGGGGAAGGEASWNSAPLGGGGSGGAVKHPALELGPGTYPLDVGAGGAIQPTSYPTSNPGGNSVFNVTPTATLTGQGGCSGGRPGWFSPFAGPTCGSGPGSSRQWPSGYPVVGGQPTLSHPGVPAGWSNYGNNGGFTGDSNPPTYASGGGGGCGGAGQGPLPSTPNILAGEGGDGQPFPGFAYPLVGLGPIAPLAQSPTNDHYGGGGGGSINLDNSQTPDPWIPPTSAPSYRWRAGNGGAGGGGGRITEGKDGTSYPNMNLANGVANLGGGGAGLGGDYGGGTAGGDGVIIIRYEA